MRLRTQLALFFILMMASVLGVGLLTVWGGVRIVDRFSDSLADVERLSQFRGLQNLMARQRAGLRIFQRTGDLKEWYRLRSIDAVAQLRFKELAAVPWAAEDLRAPAEKHAAFSALLESSPRPEDAPRVSAACLAALEEASAAMNALELALSERARAGQQDLRQLVSRGARLVFGFILWELLLAFFFAAGTFRSIHRELEALQEGTRAFGEGNFDHRIFVVSSDELGDLAQSFNKMAENIKNLEVKTVHMHRMSAVGQLAGGVAHEINNPMTGVLGQAQLLLEKMSADDPHRHHVEKIERAAVRCRRIVRSLLDFSRQKETHFAQYDLHEALNATIELCEPDLQGKRVRTVKNYSTLIPPMTGNAAQLQQVFLNLVSNAVHAMPSGGVLLVTTGLAAFEPPAGGPHKVDGIEVSIQDTGSGIAPEHLPHVFEPFFTTKEIGKGTGLGLSVSLGIVRNHGGDILVESEGTGKGAKFRVLLPLTPPARMLFGDDMAGGAHGARF